MREVGLALMVVLGCLGPAFADRTVYPGYIPNCPKGELLQFAGRHCAGVSPNRTCFLIDPKCVINPPSIFFSPAQLPHRRAGMP
jgi:hypothetical protein